MFGGTNKRDEMYTKQLVETWAVVGIVDMRVRSTHRSRSAAGKAARRRKPPLCGVFRGRVRRGDYCRVVDGGPRDGAWVVERVEDPGLVEQLETLFRLLRYGDY
jgi:hypothetical protein